MGRQTGDSMSADSHAGTSLGRHYAQIQGQLAVTELDWCDLVMYTPSSAYKSSSLEPAPHRDPCHASIVRVSRDEAWFDSVLAPCLESFGEELRRRRAAAGGATLPDWLGPRV